MTFENYEKNAKGVIFECLRKLRGCASRSGVTVSPNYLLFYNIMKPNMLMVDVKRRERRPRIETSYAVQFLQNSG